VVDFALHHVKIPWNLLAGYWIIFWMLAEYSRKLIILCCENTTPNLTNRIKGNLYTVSLSRENGVSKYSIIISAIFEHGQQRSLPKVLVANLNHCI
jgi:hypothetical protein